MKLKFWINFFFFLKVLGRLMSTSEFIVRVTFMIRKMPQVIIYHRRSETAHFTNSFHEQDRVKNVWGPG